MSARSKILEALATEIKKINGTSPYHIDLFNNVETRLKFWDEVDDYPYVCLSAGDEYREYLPSNFKWGFLTINIRIYVKDDDALEQLELILEDIETILDASLNLTYDTNKNLEDINILSISTDEGLLHPLGVGEMSIQIRYDL